MRQEFMCLTSCLLMKPVFCFNMNQTKKEVESYLTPVILDSDVESKKAKVLTLLEEESLYAKEHVRLYAKYSILVTKKVSYFLKISNE